MLSRHVFRNVSCAVPHRAVAFRGGLPRSFVAVATNDSRPPVNLFGLDGTYAMALYTAAAKTSTLDPTAIAVTNLCEVSARDTKLTQVLSTPRLSAEDKSAIVAELNKHTGANVTTIKNFLDTLAENNRLGHLQGVCEKFRELMSVKRGEVKMTVTSAQTLDSKSISQLETAVAKSSYVDQGEMLKVTSKVDPEIVGGLIVEVGDRTIDLSVSSRMGKMNKLLRHTV